jgi:ribosomal-protein-alanine N-acetyltransferase
MPARSASQQAEAEVHTIGVDPDHQGRGIGRALLEGLLGAADGIGAVTYLEVRTDNASALALYRATGFAVVGTRRRYYASGADAYTMRRPAAAPSGDPR